VTPGRPTAELREGYLAALLAGDSIRARHLVDRAVDSGVAIPAVYLDVLQPALEEVGERWAAGEVSVAYEHQATAITQGILGSLGPRMRVAPTSGRLAVLACTPGELHAIGIQMLGDFLEAAGWEVILLGASVPAGALAGLVEDESPDVVCLSTASPTLLPGARDAIVALRALDDPPFVACGGRLWQILGTDEALTAGADCCPVGPLELAAELTARFPPLSDDEEEP